MPARTHTCGECGAKQTIRTVTGIPFNGLQSRSGSASTSRMRMAGNRSQAGGLTPIPWTTLTWAEVIFPIPTDPCLGDYS
jgi:hypothetical protein